MQRLIYCFPSRVIKLYVHYDSNTIGLFTVANLSWATTFTKYSREKGRSMDDPLPKTAQDHYTYRIYNFHPSLDNTITISILKVRFEGQVYTGHPVWKNARVINGSINIYLDSPQSSRTTWISRDEDRLSPISCFPNNYYEFFVSISICSLIR